MLYKVKELAKISGISVRTLHHYDEIGLLKPRRIENGYRVYSEHEVVLLQQILFFKELEFPLNDIKEMVCAAHFDQKAALIEHKKLLALKKERIEKLLMTIDLTLTKLKGGETMNPHDSFGGFSDDQMKKYQEEAKQRWGTTDAYKQSVQRTKNWIQADYKKLAADGKAFTQKLADTMDQGFDSEVFQELIQKHYESIGVFYDCSFEMYNELGTMYVEDTRFRAYYDQFKPGLAEVMKKAINHFVENNTNK